MYVTAFRKEYGNVFLYYGCIFLIIICFIQIIPHLELLISPKLRILTPQKLIYYLGFVFVIDTAMRRNIRGLIGKTETIIIVLFISSITISSLLGIMPKLSLLNVARYLGYILIYIMISNIFISYKNIESVLFYLIPAGLILFLSGLLVYHDFSSLDSVGGAYTSIDGTTIVRKSVLNMNQNSSAYISMFLLITTLFFLFKTRIKIKKVLVYYPIIILFLYAYVNTLSRGPFVCLVIALISISFIYPIYKRKQELLGLVFLLILISSMVFLPYTVLQERILRGTAAIFQLESFQGYDADLSYSRVEQVLTTLDIIMERPFFGRGFLNLNEIFSLLLYGTSINHLFYIQLAVYVGIIGLLLYLLFFATVFLKTIKSIRRLKKDGQSSYVLGSFLLGLFVFAFVKGFFAPVLYDIWIVAGLCSAFIKIEKRERMEQRDNHLVNSNQELALQID